MQDIVVIDIETENTGYDVMKHNQRILSIQMLDEKGGKIYYDGSRDDDLSAAEDELTKDVDSGKKFVGFNVKNFDVRFIKEFLKVTIPSSQIVDIGEMPNMRRIKQELRKEYPRLIDVCDHLGIECTHKNLMDKHSRQFKEMPDVAEMAKEAVQVWKKEKPWLTPDYAYNKAIDSISTGMSILKSFNEFVESNGSPDSLFYKYAMGDVISEHALYQKMR